MTLTATSLSHTKSGVDILSNVSLSLHPGELMVLIGPNGAGKSTLLSLLAGSEQPTSGSIQLDNQPLHQYSPRQLASRRAVMSQASQVVFDFAVHEILEMGWIHSPIWGDEEKERVIDRTIELSGLGELRDRNYRTLSGGEQQRVQFCRTLVQLWRPEIGGESSYLLLDEPTSSLDVAHELRLLRQVRDLISGKIGVVVVLHDLNLAARFADSICLMCNGTIEAYGSPERVFSADVLSRIYRTPVEVELRNQRPFVYTH